MNIIDESTHKITAEEVASIFSREFFGLTYTTLKSEKMLEWIKNYITDNLEFINNNREAILESLEETSPKDIEKAKELLLRLIEGASGREQ